MPSEKQQRRYSKKAVAATIAGFAGFAGFNSGLIFDCSLAPAMAATTQDQVNGLINEGLDQARQSKHFDAINKYSEALKLNPNHHHAYFYRARSRKALADFESAVNDYNYVIKLNPKSSMAYTERGWCLTKLNLPKRAMHDFDMALKLNPKNTRALEYRASLKYKRGDFQSALGDLNLILKYKPNSSKQLAEFMLPRLNLVKRKDLSASNNKIKISSSNKEGSHDFDININTKKDHSKCDKKELAHINNLAALAIKKGKFEQAVKILQPVTEEHPDYEYARKNLTIAYNNYGLKLARNNTKEAAEKFRSALYYSPGEGTARRNLNSILKEEGKDPKSYETRLELGNEQLRAGNPRHAFVEFTEALRLNNTASGRRKLAEACLQLENQKTAQKIAKVSNESSQSQKQDRIVQDTVAEKPVQKTTMVAAKLDTQSIETETKAKAETDAQTEAGAGAGAGTEANVASTDTDADADTGADSESESSVTALAEENPTANDVPDKAPKTEAAQASKQDPESLRRANEIKARLTAFKLPAPASVTVQGAAGPQTLKGLSPTMAPRIQLSSSEILKEWSARMSTGQDRFDQGDYVGAENSFDSAAQLGESMGADSKELAISLQKLAEVYLVHKKTTQAYSLLARALVILSRHHSVDDPILVKLREKIDTLSTAIDGGTSQLPKKEGTSIATSN